MTPIRRVLHRFRPYLHGQLPLLLASLAALLGMTLMRLLEPWPLAWIVDNLLKNKTPPRALSPSSPSPPCAPCAATSPPSALPASAPKS